jgi:hypothetical protein
MIKQLALCLFVCSSLTACSVPTFREEPQPVSNLQHPHLSGSAQQTVLLWLPQTQTADFYAYKKAVQNSLKSLPLLTEMLNKSDHAQLLLEQWVVNQGGIFNSRTGRINNDALSNALDKTKADIKNLYPEVQDILLLNLSKQSVLVKSGIAYWDHTQQKITDTAVSSLRSMDAVSIEVTYLLPDGKMLNERFGLDIEPAPSAKHTKYDKVLKRVFAPYVQIIAAD